MERIERLVRTWIAVGHEDQVKETVSAIVAGEATILDVVKALGSYLTAEEDEHRTKGVEFLSLLIESCPSEKLGRNAVRVLTAFMCSKMEDTETIIPALKGINALASRPSFTSTDAVDVVRALFVNVKMRGLVQSQRFVVFTIVDTLIAHQRQALKDMGEEFISGYISLAEGEKDPRNLLLAFAIARVLLIEFEVSHHIEQLFNITFCYFPITFRPPPDDPYGITTEDLKQGLRGCLNSTPAFGSLAIPLFIEKLTAGSPVTKRDTLQTLDVCLPVYGAAIARENAKKLWSTLRLEIFQPTDVETENMALKTTQVLIQTIYALHDENAPVDEEIQGFAKDVCEECIRILKEPEKSQAKPAIKVLCAFMSTTPTISKFTLSKAVPHLVQLFLNPDEVQNRGAVLQLLSDLVVAAREGSETSSVDSAASDIADTATPALASYKDEVLGVLTVGLQVPSGRKAALTGLLGMVQTKGLLTDEELGFTVHKVNELLTSGDAEDEDISDAVLELFTAISIFSPHHVVQTTLPLLFTSLPDRAPARDAESERLKYWRTLSFLKRLCIQPDLFEMLVVRLSTKLDLVCSSSSEQEDKEPTTAYAHSLLRTLADTFARKAALGHVDIVKYLDRLVPRLFNLHVYAALTMPDGSAVASHPRLVAVSGDIVTCVLQVTTAPRQTTFLAALFAAYLQGEVSRIAEGQQKMPEGVKFAPFAPDASAAQRVLVLLFGAAVVTVHKEVVLPVPDEASFVDELLRWAVSIAESDSQVDVVLHTLATVLNKRPEAFSGFLQNTMDTFWSTWAASQAVPADTRKRAILAWAWVTKALLTRGDSLAQVFVDRLFTLFGDAEVGWDAARAIGLLASQDKVLTKKNNATIRFLFAQKFASATLPKLVEGAKSSAESSQQSSYLIALTSLIKSIPKTAYSHQLPALMPLLLRSLDLPDHEIRVNVIDTLVAIADTTAKDDNPIVGHAASLVTTMLHNSLVNVMPSPRVRAAALRYLAMLPNLVRYDILHPQKAAVLRALAAALDDPKKAVRREAVEARTNW